MTNALTITSIVAAALALSVRADRVPYPVAAILVGRPVAHDGDDLRFGRVRVRLRGIAAPEDRRGRHDPGGPEARAMLALLAEGRAVRCYLDGSTAGPGLRPVGVCFVGGLDINAAMVRAGAARDCPAHSGGTYASAEGAARAAGWDLAAIYPLPDYCAPTEARTPS